jgi:hypothetical protein
VWAPFLRTGSERAESSGNIRFLQLLWVVVTTLVLVEVVAGVAAAGDGAAAVEMVAAVEVVAFAADVVEPEDVGALPLADAIPKAAARNPPIDRRAAAARVRLAGWRRRAVLWSCGFGGVGIAASFLRLRWVPSWPPRSAWHLTGL